MAYFAIFSKVFIRISRDLYKEVYLCMRNTGGSGQKMEAFRLLKGGREMLDQIVAVWWKESRTKPKIQIRIGHVFKKIISLYTKVILH